MHLKAIFSNDTINDKKLITEYYFQKSKENNNVFSLDATCRKIPKPAHVLIDCIMEDEQLPFVFAGMEILSNSRNIEVYVISETNKEEYIQTYRGIREEKEGNDNQNDKTAEWYKCLMVQQNPTNIKRLKLKFLSLRPPGKSTTHLLIDLFQVVIKLPIATAAPTSKVVTAEDSNNDTCSKSDIKTALLTMSSMAYMTEKSIIKNLKEEIEKNKQFIQTNFEQNVNMLLNEIKNLKHVITIQNSTMKQQQETIQIILRQQQEFIENQKELERKQLQQNTNSCLYLGLISYLKFDKI